MITKEQIRLSKLEEYCMKTEKTPSQVMKSDKNRSEMIQAAYGSIDEYAKFCAPSDENSKSIQLFEKLDSLPIGILLPVIIKTADKDGRLKELSVDLFYVSKIIESYAKETAKFAKAFFHEMREITQENLVKYRKYE